LALDGNGYVTSITNPNSEVVKVTHDAHGLLTDLWDPAHQGTNQQHHFTYDGSGLLTNDAFDMVSSPGTSLSRTPPNMGWTTTAATPQSRSQTDVIDDSPNDAGAPAADPNVGPPIERRSMTNAVGIVTTDYVYGDGTRQMTYGDAGVSTTTQYAADPRFGFDGEYISAQRSVDGTTTITTTMTRSVDAGASLNNETDIITIGPTPDGGLNTYTRVYDGTQSPPTMTITSPLGRQVKTTLDTTLDRPAKYEILPGNVPDAGAPLTATQVSYDSVGRPYEVAQGTHTLTTSFDSSTGFVSSVTDPYSYVGITSHDNVGRPKAISLPGRSINTLYDANGNVTSFTPPNGQTHSFTSTPLNLLGTYTPPAVSGTGATSYGYDLDGLLTSMQQSNVVVSYLRDGLGRVGTVSYATQVDGTATVTYGYDENGRTKQIATTIGSPANVTLNYTYDGTRVTQEQYAFGAPLSFTRNVNYSYDTLARLSTRKLDTTADTTFTYAYDADSMVSSVKDNHSNTWRRPVVC
jgi:hypothetical protein